MSKALPTRRIAVVLFEGITREVPELDYEAYVEMAEPRLRAIAEEEAERHGLCAAAIEHRVGEGMTLNNLAWVYQLQGRLSDAEAAYLQSLEIKRRFGDRVGEGQTLENLALLREAQHDLPAALASGRIDAAPNYGGETTN